MKVCLLNAGFDTRLTSVNALLGRYLHVPLLAEALSGHGHQVTVIQAFICDQRLQRSNVSIELVATDSIINEQWAEITRPSVLIRKLDLLQPDVVHFFGLTMLPLRSALGRWCKRRGVPLTASFHGGYPSRNPLLRWRQWRAMKQTSAFFFSSAVAASQWRAAGLIPKIAQTALLPEVSSPFSGLSKQAARQSLGIDGDPLFVWAARLHPDKDPITALSGLRLIARAWPDMRLFMAFNSGEMTNEINAFLDSDPGFKNRVTLLGAVNHPDMETLFSAADFFVHSSRREWGSNALVEALSCGAIPVLSDIPSLRTLTEHIKPAILFRVGDAEGLARQVLELQRSDIGRLNRQVKLAFDTHLSYPVLAARYSDVFESLVAVNAKGPAP